MGDRSGPSKPLPADAVLSPREIAEAFRVDLDTIYRAIHRGELRARRVGRQWRIDRDEVLAGWVRRCAT